MSPSDMAGIFDCYKEAYSPNAMFMHPRDFAALNEAVEHFKKGRQKMAKISESKTWRGETYALELDEDGDFLLTDIAHGAGDYEVYIRNAEDAQQFLTMALIAEKHFKGEKMVEAEDGEKMEPRDVKPHAEVQEARATAAEKLTMALVSYLSEQRQASWRDMYAGARRVELPSDVVTILRRERIIP